MNKYENYTIDEMLTAIEGSYDVANEAYYIKEQLIGGAIGTLLTLPLAPFNPHIVTIGAAAGLSMGQSIGAGNKFKEDLQISKTKNKTNTESVKLVNKYADTYSENLLTLSKLSGKLIKLANSIDKATSNDFTILQKDLKHSYEKVYHVDNLYGTRTPHAVYDQVTISKSLVHEAIASDPALVKKMQKNAKGLKTVYDQVSKAIEQANKTIKDKENSDKADKEKLKALSACTKVLKKQYTKMMKDFENITK